MGATCTYLGVTWFPMTSRVFLLPLACLPLWACNPSSTAEPKTDSGAEEAAPSGETAAAASPPDQPVSGTHAVTCGCSLEHVGHCSEWVEVEGTFVELQLPESADLGKMPFCGKHDLKATVEGELKDGKVIATKFELEEG